MTAPPPLIGIAANPASPLAANRRNSTEGATSRRLAALPTTAPSPLLYGDPARRCLQVPMRARLASSRKELAANEENPPKQVCLPMDAARIRHVLLLADSRVSSIRPSRRWLSLGERSQRFDAGIHDHYRAWSVTRLHCGRRSDFRFW